MIFLNKKISKEKGPIKECDRKNLELRIPSSHCFFVRYERTYILITFNQISIRVCTIIYIHFFLWGCKKIIFSSVTTYVKYCKSPSKSFINQYMGSLGIAPTRDCTHFLKIGIRDRRGRVLFLLYPPME